MENISSDNADIICNKIHISSNQHKNKSVLFNSGILSFIIYTGSEMNLIISQEDKIMNTDKIYAEAIVNEYSKKNTSKVVALKKLDRAAKRPAEIFTYTFGIIVSLIAGVGMCMSMNVIGNGSTAFMIIGIVLGIIGFFGMGINYVLYKKILENNKSKYAADIVRLATEISNESE